MSENWTTKLDHYTVNDGILNVQITPKYEPTGVQNLDITVECRNPNAFGFWTDGFGSGAIYVRTKRMLKSERNRSDFRLFFSSEIGTILVRTFGFQTFWLV